MSTNHPCPRFNRCRASFCPLTMEGKHEEGKAICAYLRWKVKGELLPEPVAATLHDNLPKVIAGNGGMSGVDSSGPSNRPRQAQI